MQAGVLVVRDTWNSQEWPNGLGRVSGFGSRSLGVGGQLLDRAEMGNINVQRPMQFEIVRFTSFASGGGRVYSSKLEYNAGN
jgi:hypothetical protein